LPKFIGKSGKRDVRDDMSSGQYTAGGILGPRSMSPRLRTLAAGLLVLLLGLAAVTWDAARRRSAGGPARRVRIAAARVLGMPDLSLSSSSRWLRHPSQTEPSAPFADAPASLDADPGGAILGPPRERTR
jgi:hypothetical protein